MGASAQRQRVLVTGGAGFIGSHLVAELAAADRIEEVIVADDLSVGSAANLDGIGGQATVRLVTVDVRDGRAMADVAAGVHTVYHLATQCLRVSLFDPHLVSDVNVMGTLMVLQAAAQASVERFVYVSSSEIYGTARIFPMSETHPCAPTTVYGASKLAGELYALAFHGSHGLPVVVVRPFNTYGPRSHIAGLYGEVLPKFVLRAMTRRPLVIYGDGEQTRDFTYVSDTVRGIMLAANCPGLVGRAVNVAKGQEISINRLASIVSKHVGMDLRPVHRRARPADVRRHRADIRLAERLLGFTPEVGIEEGVERYVAWFRTAYADPESLNEAEETYDWEAYGTAR